VGPVSPTRREAGAIIGMGESQLLKQVFYNHALMVSAEEIQGHAEVV